MRWFDAYDATGKKYEVEEFVTVHSSLDEHGGWPHDWPGIRQFRLFDGTPVEREGEEYFSFRDKSGRLVELTTDKPAVSE